MEKGANFWSICYKILRHQLCYSLAASSLRPDALIALAVAIGSLIAAEIGIGSVSFQDLVQQTPYLGAAVSLSSVLRNYLCRFKNNTVCNRMITLLHKWGYKVQGSTDLFQTIRTALSSVDDHLFCVSWWQDQTINSAICVQLVPYHRILTRDCKPLTQQVIPAWLLAQRLHAFLSAYRGQMALKTQILPGEWLSFLNPEQGNICVFSRTVCRGELGCSQEEVKLFLLPLSTVRLRGVLMQLSWTNP